MTTATTITVVLMLDVDLLLSWCRFYLSNRALAITINGQQFQQTTLCFDVPRGSVLCPVLFIFYTQPFFGMLKKHTVNHHAAAYGNQLYKVSTPDEIHQSTEALQNCVTNVRSWLTVNKLQLNDTKIEVMIVLSNRSPFHTSLPSVTHIDDADVLFVSSVKNLGLTLDSNLSMSRHIKNTCKTAKLQN